MTSSATHKFDDILDKSLVGHPAPTMLLSGLAQVQRCTKHRQDPDLGLVVRGEAALCGNVSPKARLECVTDDIASGRAVA